MLSIFGSQFTADAVDPSSAAAITPVVGQWCNLDVCWGPAPTDKPNPYTITLSCPGATVDTAYRIPYRGHGVSAPSGLRGVDTGWNNNGVPVYLRPTECALSFWRMQFPDTTTRTITLSGAGAISVTPVVYSGPNYPTLLLLQLNPLNRQQSRLYQISWNNTYPAGGFDLPASYIGLNGILFADIQPQPQSGFTFSWAANKLRVWTSSGEASGSINFTTQGLFYGA